MTERDIPSESSTTELLAELTRTLRELERDVEPERRLRPPTPQELTRFTSEVAIPGLILLLRTNIRALELLQRTLRLAEGRQVEQTGAATEVRSRAEALGATSLSRLDAVLSELQSTVSARDGDEDIAALLERARELQAELESELADESRSGREEELTDDSVDIDVEAELRSLKDNIDDDTPDGDGDAGDNDK